MIVLSHRIDFEITDDEDIEILEMYNPSYIYKVGDTFICNDVYSEKGSKVSMGEFEVVYMKSTIEWSLIGSIQVFVCGITKIGDGLVKDGK